MPEQDKNHLPPWDEADRVDNNKGESFVCEVVGFDDGAYEFVRHRANMHDRLIKFVEAVVDESEGPQPIQSHISDQAAALLAEARGEGEG